MLQRSTFGALLLALGMGSFALTKPAATSRADDGDSKRISELIQQLGSTKFQERNAAQKELEAIGAPALEQLKKVQTTDLETNKRASELVRKMEEKLFTASLLAPKRVQLKLKDAPGLEAVSELSKLSGYAIQVLGDRTKIADKKITLDTGNVTFWEAFEHLILPSLALGISSFSFLVRLLRANLLEVSREPFITVARGKGLRRWTAFRRHALPNAFLPTLTAGGLVLGEFLAGSVLIERVFNWPGVGSLVFDAIVKQDYAIVQTFILLSAVMFVLVNLVVDLLYAVIDPRVRIPSVASA